MLNETAIALRREFDLSFAAAWRTEAEAPQNLLAVRVGGDPYAIRVDEVGGLFVDRRVVPVPTSIFEFLGLAGFRGQVAPVYDLAALLGYPRQAAPRWLVLVRFSHPVALAFDVFDAHLAVTPERVVSLAADAPEDESPGRGVRAHIFEAMRTDDAVRPIIQLQSVIEEVQQRVDSARSTKER
ncbi:chemotaxis protein CheW [Lysobacter sp. CFH 32150]|uniref:chemotaxis protein CheW n=1 Tax=Lysobacter sp. CFH 32150 TaxID=2927128 RepID=UPI001FA71219|nr:chemotaxis protein CheW [Lysobacter sp. CFH 32150]MCI4566631.1 chemotaxis protein CheW [Lysobacter sp. CFH 32150]